MVPELLVIQPPVAHSSWLWLLAAGLIVVGVGLAGLTVALWVTTPKPSRPDDSLERLRAEALAEVRAATAATDPREASRLIVAAVKRFVGTASDGDADYSSPQQLATMALRDPRLQALAVFAESAQRDCFDPAHVPDPLAVAEQGREVIRRWR